MNSGRRAGFRGFLRRDITMHFCHVDFLHYVMACS